MAVELLSIHVPKTGGTSLARTLRAALGKEAVWADYEDDPGDPCSGYSLDPDGCRLRARAEVAERPGVRAIHGHFHPSKYAWLEGPKRVAFLRHPVENLISIYYYWKTLRKGHGLFTYVRRKRLSLLEFARLPTYRWLLTRTYFGGLDPAAFDFIGFADRYRSDLERLSDLLGRPLQEFRENAKRSRRHGEERAALEADGRTMRALADLLADDIRLYERVRSEREPGRGAR